MASEKIYRIGTRGSLLALTQTKLIQKELEEKTGLKFELEIIKTQGDIQTDKPLWQLKGENFFTRELDEALISKKVDLTVHSFKDLGGLRPAEIILAGVPKRNYPHDILLMRKDSALKLPQLKKLTIGTSSPRRIYFVEKHLKKLLPHGEKINFETKMLRGNVNTRLQKLQDKEFDAIILALAGLERLATASDSLRELKKLIYDLHFMILPLSFSTPAAAQGALALECLKENTFLKEKIALISHEETRMNVLKEKAIFSNYGGGCHLAVGIHVRHFSSGTLEIHQGVKENEEIFKTEFSLKKDFNLKGKKVFLGLPVSKKDDSHFIYDEISFKQEEKNLPPRKEAHFVVTSDYTIETLKKIYSSGIIWASGLKTMKKLIEENFWVSGSSDFLGIKEIQSFKESNFLNLLFPQNLPWSILSEKKAVQPFGESISSYEREFQTPSDDYLKKLESTDFFYWTSYPQYEVFLKFLPSLKKKTHFCGMGKTYDDFLKNQIEVFPFVSLSHFKDFYVKQTN